MSKVFGILMTMLGVVVAGTLVAWQGVARTLFAGVFIIACGNLFFSWLARLHAPGLTELAIAISVDNVGIGVAGTASVAYLSGLTNLASTATQNAQFGPLFPLLGKLDRQSGEKGKSVSVRDDLGGRSINKTTTHKKIHIIVV